MATKKHTSGARTCAVLGLLLALLVPAPTADAFIKERPATQWGNIYAGTSDSGAQSPKEKIFFLEKKSKFVIKYNNFPEWAKEQFQAAADVWSANFQSSVPVTIDVSWTRTSSSDILGSARPGSFFSGFVGAPDQSLWYASALANALAGRDLNGNSPEMVIQVNSFANWFRGTTGLPGNNEYDLQSVFLHEMAHGLGFLSNDSYDSFFNLGSLDEPTPYDAYAQTEDGRRLADLDSPSLELGLALRSKLVWSGPLGIAANGGEKPLLHTPSTYQDGSSVSHLDDATYSSAGKDSVMTPSLNPGEVFHEPGPLLLAMMQDMRNKPPVGIAVGIPQGVRNPEALISDSSAIIQWDPPSNARAAQISSYTVKNLKSGAEKSVTSSPVVIDGLKNGTTYTFSITALNSLGSSGAITTGSVTPQKAWVSKTIDSNADAKSVASATFNGQPVVVYTDAITGALKMALWQRTSWKRITVDGRGGSSGRTRNQIGKSLSICVNGYGTNQALHIFYSDITDLDLRYALYNGRTFKYEIVDGNGPAINKYDDPIRVRTASDVSIANTCVANLSGVQVFYRDESQGVLLGASKTPTAQKWDYELIDGDRKTDGRTTGDVGFHLGAIFDGKQTHLIFDSVLELNKRNEVTFGAIRLASRSNLSPTAWNYRTLDVSDEITAVPGYDVSIHKSYRGILATWLISTPQTLPRPQGVRWSYITSSLAKTSIAPTGFGAPSRYLSTDGATTIFNCQDRLCAMDIKTNKVSLVTSEQNSDGTVSDWIVLNKTRYLVAGVGGKLLALRP